MPTLIETYVSEVRQVRASGAATDERSFYPPLQALLSGVGASGSPAFQAITDPSGSGGDFPDLLIIERQSRAVTIPVEAKGFEKSVAALVALDQGERYARSFGGGLTLLTNFHQIVLGRLTGSGLVEERTFDICPRQVLEGDPIPGDLPSDEDLLAFLNLGMAPRATLSRPEDVATLLADHAKAMVEKVNASGDPKELLAPVWELFESGLGAELDDSFFAPTVVQTLVYGLFASWLTSDSPSVEFEWQSASYQVEVPLFADVLHASLRPRMIRECDLFPLLAGVAGVLRRVDRDAFVDRIGDGVLALFYEPFLAQFDEGLRSKLGVWYTPSEIADYQVAQCHQHLKDHLGKPAGLADESVIILDPAAGTGTYLASVYRTIYEEHRNNGEPPNVAASRLRKAVVAAPPGTPATDQTGWGRVVGFELLPSAFIIGHLHLTRTLANDFDVSLDGADRLSVYLTNALTGWDANSEFPTLTLFPDIDDELEAARRVKQQEPVLVVLGNPPYEGYTSAQSEEEKLLIAPWIEPLYAKWGIRKHRLNDLYARFWKAAVNRIELTGTGIVSFISNRQWIAGRSYPEMRESIATSFDHILVDDLHGDVHDRSHAGDESVFTTSIATGIRVGTAIVTATRTTNSDTPAKIQRRDHRGSANSKRAFLAKRSGEDGTGPYENLTSGFEPVETDQKRKWRFTGDPGTDYPFLDDYFTINPRGDSFFSGVQTIRDNAVLAFNRAELADRMQDYFNSDLSWDQIESLHPGFAETRARYNPEQTRARLLDSSTFRPERIVRFLHHPMDARWMYWEPDHKLLNEARRDQIPYWVGVENQRALVAPQTRRRDGAARPLTASQVPNFASVDPDGRVFPRLRPGTQAGLSGDELGGDDELTPTVTAIAPEWIAAARASGAAGTDDEIGDQVFYAVVAITSSPEWLQTQELRSGDLPSVPLPANPDRLSEAAEIGRLVGDLMDPDIDVEGVTTGNIQPLLRPLGEFDSNGPYLLEHGSFGRDGGRRVDDSVLWGPERGWRNIPDHIWNYRLGGFNPISKMLSYRVGMTLSDNDRELVMKLARRIQALINLESKADVLYQAAHDQPLVA